MLLLGGGPSFPALVAKLVAVEVLDVDPRLPIATRAWDPRSFPQAAATLAAAAPFGVPVLPLASLASAASVAIASGLPPRHAMGRLLRTVVRCDQVGCGAQSKQGARTGPLSPGTPVPSLLTRALRRASRLLARPELGRGSPVPSQVFEPKTFNDNNDNNDDNNNNSNYYD